MLALFIYLNHGLSDLLKGTGNVLLMYSVSDYFKQCVGHGLNLKVG